MSRTRNSIVNFTLSMVGQFFGLLFSFVSRIFFIRYLGEEYLGINGLFSNILTMLSLVELGVGPAMVYSLYRPLAEHDQERLKSLMRLYRRAYIAIGCAIGILGVLMTPFLQYLMKELPNVPHIRLIFVLFVVNSSISYFYSYKRSLIISDQKRYIATIYRYGFYFAVTLVQILFLLLTRDFILYLLLQIAGTFLENYFVSRKADRMYPFLRERNIAPLPKETLNDIQKNVSAMVFHKIGSIVVTATDNLLISRIIGIVAVGFYSNYQLVINALTTITAQFGTAIIASVGNLGATEDKGQLLTVFHRIQFFYFWIFGFCTISLFCLFQPFISLSFGATLLLPAPTMAVLVLNFYLTGMRRTVWVFRDALGLYWYDRYKPLFESLINLVASIALGKFIGITGIFLGTTISTVTICLWVEPLMLYRYGFSAPLRGYFIRYFSYTLATIAALAGTASLCLLLPAGGIGAFLGRVAICAVIPNIVFLLLFARTSEFRFFLALISGFLQKIKGKHRT